MLIGKENGTKVFNIPVEWVVTETLKVREDSLEEAVKFIVDNIELIPCGTNTEYIDGTYRISADEDWDSDVKKICRNLEMYGYKEREADKYDTVDKKIGGAA